MAHDWKAAAKGYRRTVCDLDGECGMWQASLYTARAELAEALEALRQVQRTTTSKRVLAIVDTALGRHEVLVDSKHEVT